MADLAIILIFYSMHAFNLLTFGQFLLVAGVFFIQEAIRTKKKDNKYYTKQAIGYVLMASVVWIFAAQIMHKNSTLKVYESPHINNSEELIHPKKTAVPRINPVRS